jgi:hypothetical protein
MTDMKQYIDWLDNHGYLARMTEFDNELAVDFVHFVVYINLDFDGGEFEFRVYSGDEMTIFMEDEINICNINDDILSRLNDVCMLDDYVTRKIEKGVQS